MLLPVWAIWQAREIGGGYQFTTHGRPGDIQAIAYHELIEKIKKGLAKKSLVPYPDNPSISNVIELSDGRYGLNSVGTARITLDEEAEDQASLVIDGQVVSIEDFGRALTAYEGMTLDFQIRDCSDPVLEDSMILLPVSIDPEQIYQRLIAGTCPLTE